MEQALPIWISKKVNYLLQKIKPVVKPALLYPGNPGYLEGGGAGGFCAYWNTTAILPFLIK